MADRRFFSSLSWGHPIRSKYVVKEQVRLRERLLQVAHAQTAQAAIGSASAGDWTTGFDGNGGGLMGEWAGTVVQEVQVGDVVVSKAFVRETTAQGDEQIDGGGSSWGFGGWEPMHHHQGRGEMSSSMGPGGSLTRICAPGTRSSA